MSRNQRSATVTASANKQHAEKAILDKDILLDKSATSGTV